MTDELEATYDLICYAMACPRCGHVAADPCEIDLQTKIFAHKRVRCLRVGDAVELDADPVWNWGYFRLQSHTRSDHVSVLETWTCPNCAANFVWALVTIENGRIHEVRPVELTAEALDSADYISAQAQFYFPTGDGERLRGLTLDQLKAEIATAALPENTNA